MSGRSAYVRKEKTKVKDGGHESISDATGTSLSDFPMPMQTQYEDRQNGEISTVKSSGSDELGRGAYARVRKPHVPVLEVSGIEKSSFRSVMDKKSESIRKGLVKTFGKKKKTEELESRATTSTAYRSESHELDSGDYVPPPAVVKPRQQQNDEPEFVRPGPPQTKLPPIPAAPVLKRWVGGKPPHTWNKIRRDPELWNPNGDTLIFLGLEARQSTRPSPSIRLSSTLIKNSGSSFLMHLLEEGATNERNSFGLPPSPVSSPVLRSGQPVRPGYLYTPPVSDGGTNGFDSYDGQISYELCFPTPPNKSQMENARYNITTRNVFAYLHGVPSLVGFNLVQALNDLVERLQSYLPEEPDVSGMLIDQLSVQGFDDLRDHPSTAAGLLAWSESAGVSWENGYREAFVHCAGMYNQVEATPEYKYVSHYTKKLLERGNLRMLIRVQNCQDLLAKFDFQKHWPVMQEGSLSRAAFLRLQKFFLQYYQSYYGSWPPAPLDGHDQWLHRTLTQKLQSDFGALYDYFVNRDIVWDRSEKRSGRKWNLVNPANASFQADTRDCNFTDLIVAFDNSYQYQHIPHSYPLVPEPPQDSSENIFKTKRSNMPQDEKDAELRAAAAYTASDNIYLLGSDYVDNDLVNAFIKFEKGDRADDGNYYAARRGRWVLIYYILQSLATISVDSPEIRYTGNVLYHLCVDLQGTPPWERGKKNPAGTNHLLSHCWVAPLTWPQNEASHNSIPSTLPQNEASHNVVPSTLPQNDASHNNFPSRNLPYPPLAIRSAPQAVTSSDAEGSLRSPTMNFLPAPPVGHKTRRTRRNGNHEGGQGNGYAQVHYEGGQYNDYAQVHGKHNYEDGQHAGYAQAHQNGNHDGSQYNDYAHADHHHANKIDEWATQEEDPARAQPQKELQIKDFDEYEY